uniref:Expressed protein n=1 Tax=Echinococcus granulosus TaxID=6210 RepID=A0A068WXM2_ECHGR|nr:expressed protein [Echinococcus granulosus]
MARGLLLSHLCQQSSNPDSCVVARIRMFCMFCALQCLYKSHDVANTSNRSVNDEFVSFVWIVRYSTSQSQRRSRVTSGFAPAHGHECCVSSGIEPAHPIGMITQFGSLFVVKQLQMVGEYSVGDTVSDSSDHGLNLTFYSSLC